MRRTLTLLGIVAVLASAWSRLSAQTPAPTASTTATTSTPPAVQGPIASDGSATTAAALFIVQVDDTSGTMAPAINAVAANEAEQYRRGVRPDDVFLRVEFKCRARVSNFVAIHTADDIGRLAQVLAQPRETRGDTCPSDGLALARVAYEKDGAGRAAVLALTTDGEIDPGAARTSEEEHRLLETEARWWRDHAVARALVAIDRGGASHRGLEFLASALDARVVPLHQFAAANLIQRQVQIAREAVVADTNASKTASSPAKSAPKWLVPIVAAVSFAVLLVPLLGIRARRRRPSAAKKRTSVTMPKLETTTTEIDVTVTDRGRVSRFKRTLQGNEPDHMLTFGEGGAVAVAGLREPGVTLFKDAESGELLVSVPAGVHIVVDGREAPGAGGTIPVRRGFTIRSAAFASVIVTSKTAPVDVVGMAMAHGGSR